MQCLGFVLVPVPPVLSLGFTAQVSQPCEVQRFVPQVNPWLHGSVPSLPFTPQCPQPWLHGSGVPALPSLPFTPQCPRPYNPYDSSHRKEKGTGKKGTGKNGTGMKGTGKKGTGMKGTGKKGKGKGKARADERPHLVFRPPLQQPLKGKEKSVEVEVEKSVEVEKPVEIAKSVEVEQHADSYTEYSYTEDSDSESPTRRLPIPSGRLRAWPTSDEEAPAMRANSRNSDVRARLSPAEMALL